MSGSEHGVDPHVPTTLKQAARHTYRNHLAKNYPSIMSTEEIEPRHAAYPGHLPQLGDCSLSIRIKVPVRRQQCRNRLNDWPRLFLERLASTPPGKEAQCRRIRRQPCLLLALDDLPFTDLCGYFYHLLLSRNNNTIRWWKSYADRLVSQKPESEDRMPLCGDESERIDWLFCRVVIPMICSAPYVAIKPTCTIVDA
jgi:hypothetical protein